LTPLVPIALFGWIPVTVLLFAVLPGRWALLTSLLGGWLFLPVAGYAIAGLPDYTKSSAISFGLMLGVMLCDGRRALTFRPHWIDLPMALWCSWPLVSALAAGMGLHAGLSAVLEETIRWGIPYMLGRIYFTDRAALNDVLRAIAYGGLVYMPFCWWELRMSPNLHYYVYGFSQHQFAQTIRGGGWRPQVFLQHGLALTLFMTTACLATAGLHLRPARQKLLWFSPFVCLLLLVATTLLCHSLGAVALLFLGAAVLLLSKRGSRTWILAAALALAPLWILGRYTDTIHTGAVLSALESHIPASRLGSLRMRLETEDVLIAKAKRRPLVGWGPWGGYRLGAGGQDLVKATDGFWIITLGKYGLGGLCTFLLMFLLPARAVLGSRHRGSHSPPGLASATLLVLLAVYLVDAMMNAMPNPLYVMIAGALGTVGSCTSNGPTVATAGAAGFGGCPAARVL
jgi:hypothetical protein